MLSARLGRKPLATGVSAWADGIRSPLGVENGEENLGQHRTMLHEG